MSGCAVPRSGPQLVELTGPGFGRIYYAGQLICGAEVQAGVAEGFPVEGIVMGEDQISAAHRFEERRIRAADAMAMDMKPGIEAKGSQSRLIVHGSVEMHELAGGLFTAR